MGACGTVLGVLETDDPMGQRVRLLRLQQALSQLDLAQRAGVSRYAVLRLERGSHVSRPSTVRKVAHALGVSPMALTIGTVDKSPAPRMQPAVRG